MVMTDQRVVVVTGASAGVGRATARLFAARGYRVALLARGTEGLDAAAEEIGFAGGRALPVEVDVADARAVAAAADTVADELGPVDVWVNNAFSSVFARFDDIEPDEFQRITDVCYLGFVNGTRAALRQMRPRDRGAIVQVGSALGYRGIPLQPAYCGAKHAIKGFTESLRCELLHDRSGVRVTTVVLPAVNTPQFDWVLSRLPRRAQPVPPIYQPEIAARAVVHAAEHPRRRAYWVGGSTVGTLLANAVAPGLLDRYLARTGFAAQQTDQARGPAERGNLWQPVDDRAADFGAHGSFDRRAVRHSPQAWASRHHGLLGGVAAGLAAGTVWLLARGRTR
jgi:NAD(P)-dependent dehydrogenase (short-subunit alcohol dehydrogenase family)